MYLPIMRIYFDILHKKWVIYLKTCVSKRLNLKTKSVFSEQRGLFQYVSLQIEWSNSLPHRLTIDRF